MTSLVDWPKHMKTFLAQLPQVAVLQEMNKKCCTWEQMGLQEASRQVLGTAERPLPGHPQSQQGALREALPLPALVAPALAAANPDHAYLRWKAVIHSMPSTTAAAHGPDFRAAKWFHDQMSCRDGSAAVPCNHGKKITSCFCFCLGRAFMRQDAFWL